METKCQKISIGEYEVIPIPTGEFGLDGGSMFGTVPKVLWEKSNPADSQNRIQLEARALLLKSKTRNVLIDCGNGSDFIEKYGEKMGSKFAEIYKVESQTSTLEKSLLKVGLTFNDITDVVLTHLHFDHAGGSTCFRNGQVSATFPNAKYYVQKDNLLTATTPNIREKASYLPANFKPLLESGHLQVLDGSIESEIPQIRSFISNGHTQGHQCLIITTPDQKQGLIYCGDVVPTSSHVRSAWVMGYDLNPLQIIEEKRALLKIAAANDYYLFFEHDPFCDGAKVREDRGDYTVTEKFWF
jgi:glyoxylase-like metal-dependent hydrolase (beta-lactamase superfamily II)